MNTRGASLRLGITLALAAAVLSAFVGTAHRLTGGFEHWTLEEARRAQVPRGGLQAPAMPLVTQQGEQLTAWGAGATPARVYIAHFIYTRCPTVCLSLGTAFQQMQDELRRDASSPTLHLLSLSIDPAHDTPSELLAYARRHRADIGRWTVAAPLSRQGVAQFRKHWGIVVIPDGEGGFVHNGSIHLVDAMGTVRGIYDDGDWRHALAHATQLARAAS